tara:strand:- start:960 stop:1757 length:798 start_codon:yes stop_codon:yes gene_type:complete
MPLDNDNFLDCSELFVIGNWKMNGRLSENEKYIESLSSKIDFFRNSSIFCGLAVPYPYLFQFSNRLIDTSLHLGVQEISSEMQDGPHTGDVSAEMIKEFSCSFVLIGHSERRAKYKEEQEELVKKAKVSIKEQLIPVICVGENLTCRKLGNAENFVKSQLNYFTTGLAKEELVQCVFAYEPLWAIGSGENADPNDANEMHSVMKSEFKKFIGSDEYIKIIYGGSVTADNAQNYFAQPNIDGALIGGVSLDPHGFSRIIHTALETK